MFEKLQKMIRRKWYQSYAACLRSYEAHQEAWMFILQQAELANEVWHVETVLVSPARDSLISLSDG